MDGYEDYDYSFYLVKFITMSKLDPIALNFLSDSCTVDNAFIVTIQQVLLDTQDVLFAFLVGSRANNSATDASDWDIAIQWRYGDALARIAKHELLRHRLASMLAMPDSQIDLIDLSDARLAMQALAAEEGCLMVANDELAWAKFLTRTWRDLEDYYWERAHAA